MSAKRLDPAAFGGSEAAADGTCIRYEQGENIVPENGRIYGPCLDELRAADRERREEASRL